MGIVRKRYPVGSSSLRGGVLAAALWASCAQGETAEGRGLAVAAIGPVDPVLVSNVTVYVRANCRCPVRVYAADLSSSLTPAVLTNVVARLREPDDVCIVALIEAGDVVDYREIVSATNRVAILNLSVLMPAKPLTQRARPAFETRVRKETMRLTGHLLGLPACPFPLCCMFDAKTYQELDSKATNFCPPCHVKVMDVLQRLDIKKLPPVPMPAIQTTGGRGAGSRASGR